jgi:peptide/nickel transport system substrate-binding protein
MKRSLVNLLSAVLLCSFTLAGCGGGTTTTTGETTAAQETKTETAAETKEETEKTEETKPAANTMPTEFKQSPMLDSVANLPPLKDRLPKEPKLTNEMPADMLDYQIGTYGGELRTVTSVVDWDADVFVMNNEALLNTPGILGKEITGNVLKGYDVTPDQKEFTFYLREGLKWSDGEPVTMEDFRFTIEDLIGDKEYTPIYPDWLCAGGSNKGNPMKFEVVDDWTFKIKFDQPYGAFPIRLAIQGWRGYTDLLKPAHYLKQFHPKYGDKAAIDKEMKENKFDSWIQLMSLKNVNNWDLTKKKSIGYPSLYPWILKEAKGNQYVFERNPYYFKVDAEGNQLPYIDKIVSNLVQDIEMVGMKTIAGEVDFSRESAALIKMPLYKENEKNGITALLASMHVTPTDVLINQTYKDPTWKTVAQDVRFRKALNYAMNRDDIINTIYYGFAEPGKIVDSTYNPEEANKLLDEMGMKKGSDGIRTAPDGKKFSFVFEVGAQAPDIVPLTELIVAEWQKLGLNVTMKRIESSLWDQKIAANEIQVTMIWSHTPLYYMNDWLPNVWGNTWNLWRTNKGTKGEEPPAAVKAFYDKMDKLSGLSPEEAQATFEELKADMKENLWYFVHIDNVKQPLIINSKLRNVSDKGFAIAANFSAEQFFFEK